MATIRQKRAVTKTSENLGKPMGKILRKAGYSKSVSETPSIVTESKGWNDLIDKVIPESKAVKALGELLDSYGLDMFIFPNSMEDKEIKKIIVGIKGSVLKKIEHGETQKRAYFYFPNPKAKKDGLDLYFKIKNKYPSVSPHGDGPQGITNNQVNIYNLTEPQRKEAKNALRELIGRLERLREQTRGRVK